MSAVTFYEAGIVMRARAGAGGLDDLNDLLQEISAEIVPFDRLRRLLPFKHTRDTERASIRRHGSILATAPHMRSPKA